VLQFAIGAGFSAAAAVLENGTAVPMAAVIFTALALSAVAAHVVKARKRSSAIEGAGA
jgi:hypothetical protein